MRALLAVPAALAGVAAGFVLGRATAPEREAPDDAAGPALAAANARADRAEAELAAVRETRRRPRDAGAGPAGEIPADSRVPHDEGRPPAAEPAPAAPMTASAREHRVHEISAAIGGCFQAHEGDKALALLKELASLVPEGRDAAMKLAVDMNADVQGAGELRLPVQIFYVGLGDPGITRLMNWSLANPASSTPEFRVLSAWSIPYADQSVQASEQTIARLETALATETNRSVQAALIGSLAEMRSPKGNAVLTRVVGDAARDPGLRAEVLVAIATSQDPAVARAVESAAADPDPAVRSAARVAQVLRDPPVTGAAILTTTPDGAADAAGLRPGDIVVSYNGRATAGDSDLRRELTAASGAAEPLPVVFVRDGEQHTVQVRPGRLGVSLRSVTKK